MEPVTVEAREDGRINVEIGFRDKENLKEVPGARWKHDERTWTVPMSWAALQQLRGVFGDRLTVGERLGQMSWEVWEQRVKPALELRVAQDAPWIDEPRLTPLQKAAVAFLMAAGCAVESDPMGAGKTPMTVCTVKRVPDPFPMLVVCPNGVKPHWRNEVATWWDEAKGVSVVKGGIKQRREAIDAAASGQADVVAINWETLLKHSRVSGYGNIRLSDKEKEPKELNEIQFRTVVADEAHRAKDPKAKQTRALWAVGDGATYRYALTGTPIANSPEDLWAVMRFVCPAEYPSKVAFVERYALMSWSAFGYMQVVGLRGDTREELFRFLDPRLIRRPKELILPELKGKLPPLRRLVDLPPKQRKAYDSLKKDMLAQLDGGTLMASEPLQQFGRLRQLAAATGEIDENGEVQLKEPSAKVSELVQVLEELGDEKAIVFAESQKLIEVAAARLAKEGVDCAMYTGQQSEDEREANRVGFQEGNIRVLLLTYGAGAEGINLSAAGANIKLERATSMVKDQQADERSARPGQEVPTRMIHIFAADTVDWAVERQHGEKVEMLQEVCRDEATLKVMLAGAEA